MSTEKPTDLAPTEPKAGKLAHYTASPIAQAIDALEVEMGGRAELLKALAAVDPTDDLSYLAGVIADPRNDAVQLSHLCRAAGVPLGELLASYKAGLLATATVSAIKTVAARTPALIEDIMRRAAPYEDACYTCGGKAHTPDPRGADHPLVPCETCGATGTLIYKPDLDRQKLALTLTPFGAKAGPAVQVAVDNRSVSVNDSSPQGLARLLEVTDQFLHRRSVAPRRVPTEPSAEPIDAEVVTPPDAEIV